MKKSAKTVTKSITELAADLERARQDAAEAAQLAHEAAEVYRNALAAMQEALAGLGTPKASPEASEDWKPRKRKGEEVEVNGMAS